MECWRDEYGGWRKLPSEILAEPDWLLSDLLQLKGAATKFEAQLEKKRREAKKKDGERGPGTA